LLEAHIAVYDKYLRYQMVADIYRGDIAAREHKELLDSALRRDVAGGQATLLRHVEDCVETALARGDKVWLSAFAAQPPTRNNHGAGDNRSAPRELHPYAVTRRLSRARPSRGRPAIRA
jgi:hypothetical protein